MRISDWSSDVCSSDLIGYPPVRMMSPPDNQVFPWLMGMRRAMEMMLTGDSPNGVQAVEAGFANRAFPAESLDAEVLAMAETLTKVPRALPRTKIGSAPCQGRECQAA